MESIIDQEQLDKVVEFNEKFNKCVVVLEDAVQISNECIKSLEQLKEIAIDEEKIDWKEKYNIALELLTEKDNKIKELESHIAIIFKGNRECQAEIDRKTIIIQAYRKDNEALRKRLKDKYWKLFEKIAPYFILLIFALGLMFHLI